MKKDIGDIIAYWNTGVKTETCIKAVGDALKKIGYDTTDFVISSYVEKTDEPGTLGLPPTRINIALPKPVAKHRDPDKNTIDGVRNVKLRFSLNRGFYDLDKHAKFNEKKAGRRLETAADVEKITKSTKFDGKVYEFNMRTDGRIRDFRKHEWYPYEGSGHFQYAATMKDLTEKLAESLYDTFIDMGVTGA